jgi:hypothetical protein
MYQVEKGKYYKILDKTIPSSPEMFFIYILEVYPDTEFEYADVSGLCIIYDNKDMKNEVFFTIDSCRHFSLNTFDKILEIKEIGIELFKKTIIEYANKI